MILEDFTMLGTTVPEPTSDGRVFVCSAGISPEAGGLIRIYPLARKNIPHRWSTYRVPLERNPKDSRPESFRLQGDRSCTGHPIINNTFKKVGELKPTQRAATLNPYLVGSIKEANARKLSLAIIQPSFGTLDYEHNPESPDSPMLTLFDPVPRPEAGAKRFPYIPRLHFTDEIGLHHHLMVRDWGCFEWMRKNPDRYRELDRALHLSEHSSLLIGNFNRHRTSWLIISVINGIRDTLPTLFDCRPKIPPATRSAVFKRDGHACQNCGATDDLTLDHIQPWSLGGDDAVENLRVLCRPCNSRRGNRMETDA